MNIETHGSPIIPSDDAILRMSDKDSNESNSIEPENSESDTTSKANVNEAAIDRETVIKRLKEIPVEKLKEIMTNQIDLEVRLKHKELRLTEEEIAKCESQMIALRKFFEIPKEVKFDSEPTDFTKKYYNLLNQSLSVNITNLQNAEQNHRNSSQGSDEGNREPVHSYRTRSTTSSLRPSGSFTQRQNIGCLYRRTDGVIVKLTCPDCLRSNFSSAQGFLNHSRIAHSKEYTSQDAAALKCGQILPDEEQDEEGLASLRSLQSKNLDPNCNLNVNEVYFNGLSQTLNTVHKNSTSAPAYTPSPSAAGRAGHDTSISSTSKERSISPLHKIDRTPSYTKEQSELMKKLIKNGVASSESDFNSLIQETTAPVMNAHLFEGESDGVESDPESDSRPRSKHRRSRSSVDLSSLHTKVADKQGKSSSRGDAPLSRTVPLAETTAETTADPAYNSGATDTSASAPKIKLKLRIPHEDLKRRKRN